MSQQTASVWGLGTDLPTKTTAQVIFNLPAGTTETDITDLVFPTLTTTKEISLDMTNLSNTNTLRIYQKIDGTNYKQAKEMTWPDDTNSTGNETIDEFLIGLGVDCKVTIQSAVNEGGVNIPITVGDLFWSNRTTTQYIFNLPSGTSEQDITDLVLPTATKNELTTGLDMSNVIQGGTLRAHRKVDTTNYRQIESWDWPDNNASPDNKVLQNRLNGLGVGMKLTYQSDSDEGGISIPIAQGVYSF